MGSRIRQLRLARWFTRFADRLDALISTHLQDRYQLTLGYDDQ
ncbi:hypothetical protein J2Z21_009324 [Streptomyces griseochromogenes]|uniref:Transposase n=1 Tax=Streptomyces griseochromogenes TaxID=68214 RepID=A0ABS4M9E9_9ACTN|nr:hypothetical protein [Streptomyces griseochromogenes]MBP2056306.1 hypothetical protein [Streptomyces griseochromogenes]